MASRTFGTYLRELRVERGLTQQNLAESLHYTKSWISRLESDKKKPNLDQVKRLDRALRADGQLIRCAVNIWPRLAPKTNHRAELPPNPAMLVGREAELTRIVRHLQPTSGPDGHDPMRVCLIRGLTEVGKTDLASRAANELKVLFPDGQLCLDLHGNVPDQPSVPIDDALESLWRRFRPGEKAPRGTIDDLLGELRTITAGKRFLVLVENAPDGEQVERLLSALPGSSAIVTSWRRLTGMDHACRVDLRELSDEDGEELFRQCAGPALDERAGHRRDDPKVGERIRRIVRSCYGLPFAIRGMAGKFRDNRAWTLDSIEQTLQNASARLTAASDGGRSITGIADTTNRLLRQSQQEALSTLSAHPGIRIDHFSGAVLLGVQPTEAQKVLADLFDTSTVVEHQPAAYQIHSFLREFLQQRGNQVGLSGRRRKEVARQLFDYYLRAVMRADEQIGPGRDRDGVRVELLPDQPVIPDLDSEATALRWLDTERVNLLDVCSEMQRTGLAELCWQFCFFLLGYFYRRKRWTPWPRLFQYGWQAARKCRNDRIQGIMLNNVGLAFAAAGAFAEAARYQEDAISAFTVAGDDHGLAGARADLESAHNALKSS